MHPLAIVWISHLIITHRITIYMKLQVSATMKIRPGMIEGFKNQAAECISQVKHKDPGTLQYDWLLIVTTQCVKFAKPMKIPMLF